MTAASTAKISAGAFQATIDGLTGTIRGRVIPAPPLKEDFERFEISVPHETETGVKFAYPPLPWIGARFKFDVRELNGQKVFAKSFDRILFQRGVTFIAPSNLSNYTMQADILTDGSARVKSDIGLSGVWLWVAVIADSSERVGATPASKALAPHGLRVRRTSRRSESESRDFGSQVGDPWRSRVTARSDQVRDV